MARRYDPMPAGLVVLARDKNAVLPDETLGSGVVGLDGRVQLTVERGGEREPELYFELRFAARFIDLESGSLVASADPPRAVLELPEVWTTRDRYSAGYTRGLWNEFTGDAIGSPADPIAFRVTFDAFVRFVQWDEQRGGFTGLPEGTQVDLVEHDPLRRKTVLARGALDDHGRAQLTTTQDHEHQPDLSLELSTPDGLWSSRAHFAAGSLNRRGYWDDHIGTRIGRWGSPYTFDLSGPAPRRLLGNRVRPLIDGPAILQAMTAAISGAQHTIHLQVMLLYADPAGQAIVDLLVEQAARGVTVRLMYDAQTTSTSHRLAQLKAVWARTARRISDEERRTLLKQLAEEAEAERARGNTDALMQPLRDQANAQILDTGFPYVSVAPQAAGPEPAAYRDLRAELPFFGVARIDHRKLMIVDGRRALLGGANVGQEYLYREAFDPTVPAEHDPFIKWHDCFVEIEGPAAQPLQSLFRERWVAEGGDAFDRGAATGAPGRASHPTFPLQPRFDDGIPVSVLDTTPGARLHIHAELLSLLSKAEREIWIQNPYFSSREVLHRLCDAARRGVRVVCIFPDEHNDSWDFLYAARLKYPELIDAGVAVYEYNNHMTHAKVAVVDDVTVIGSANLNHASFFNHYEVAALVHDAEFTAQFRRDMFEHDLQHSVRVHAHDVEALLDIEDWVRPYLRWVVDGWF